MAGGFGTRLAEYTDLIPKPMVEIGRKPILWHIMKIYSYFGFNDFIALGYKSEIIKRYFWIFKTSSDFTIDLSNGEVTTLKNKLKLESYFSRYWFKFYDRGRIKRLEEQGMKLLCTYGDGVADININES